MKFQELKKNSLRIGKGCIFLFLSGVDILYGS